MGVYLPVMGMLDGNGAVRNCWRLSWPKRRSEVMCTCRSPKKEGIGRAERDGDGNARRERKY